MKQFKPTYLYIKQHSVTGKCYFGKTTGSESYLLEQYQGSGEYWKDHIKKHGVEHVTTVWYCLFTEKEECNKFALMCSEQWDIVNSDQWANLITEDGLAGGGMKGRNCGRPGIKRGPQTVEHKAARAKSLSIKLKGVSKPKLVTRLVDKKEMSLANFANWQKQQDKQL